MSLQNFYLEMLCFAVEVLWIGFLNFFFEERKKFIGTTCESSRIHLNKLSAFQQSHINPNWFVRSPYLCQAWIYYPRDIWKREHPSLKMRWRRMNARGGWPKRGPVGGALTVARESRWLIAVKNALFPRQRATPTVFSAEFAIVFYNTRNICVDGLSAPATDDCHNLQTCKTKTFDHPFGFWPHADIGFVNKNKQCVFCEIFSFSNY